MHEERLDSSTEAQTMFMWLEYGVYLESKYVHLSITESIGDDWTSRRGLEAYHDYDYNDNGDDDSTDFTDKDFERLRRSKAFRIGNGSLCM